MTWVRRNRVGLALLPIALTAALAANASGIVKDWYPRGFNERMGPDENGVVQVVDAFDDGFIRYPIRPKVSLVSVEQAETVSSTLDGVGQPATTPPGTTLWRVVIRVEADPNMVLRACKLALADGTSRWDSTMRSFESRAYPPSLPCVPSARPGPDYTDPKRGPVVDINEVRPASYETHSYVVTPSSARPTEVLLWWHLPRYAALPITSLG